VAVDRCRQVGLDRRLDPEARQLLGGEPCPRVGDRRQLDAGTAAIAFSQAPAMLPRPTSSRRTGCAAAAVESFTSAG
jgi:hypothetical protein